MTATLEPELGRARKRKEDARLITGRTRWTDNMVLPGTLSRSGSTSRSLGNPRT